MFWAPIWALHTITDNYGATITEAGIGTSVNAHATNANQKGTPVSLIAGSAVTADVFGISIMFAGGVLAANIRRFLADLLIDNAGGSSWSTLIPNLFVNSPSLLNGGYRYYFPIWVKAGSSFGLQQQCSTANISLRCAISLYGKPKYPELIRVGSKVETFGVVTASTSGTAVTPGNGVVGAYADLGVSVNDLWWWQWGGVGVNDTTVTPQKGMLGDVAAGDATNKKLCVDNCIQVVDTSEQFGKDSFGMRMPVREISGGNNIYVRVSGSGAADTTPTTTAYGLG